MELGAATRLIALMSSILIALTTTPIQARAKCSGRYMIHSCFAGNGKRSERLSSNSGRLTVASKLREARKDALRSILESSLQSKRETWGLLDALQHKVNTRHSDQDIASEFEDWLKETSHSREDSNVVPLESPVEDVVDQFDNSNDDENDDKVDVEEVRDLLAALTIQHALNSQTFHGDKSESGDQIVL